MEGTEENNSMDEMNREAGETVTAEKKRRVLYSFALGKEVEL